MTQLKINSILLTILLFTFVACEDDEPGPTCDGTLAVTVGSTVDSSCGDNTGSITVASTGGSGTVSYQLDGGTSQMGTTFADVSPGMYTVKVTDENGCTAETQASISSGVVLADIKPIITTNCAISNCHNGDRNTIPDFSMDANMISGAAGIKTRTGNGTMPPAGSPDLTNAQIQEIACWVDDGAPQ